MSISTKMRVGQLLKNKDFAAILEIAGSNKSTARYLFSFLYSSDDLLHWRAAEALGEVAKTQSVNDDDSRNIPRRLVWSLMEESGSTAWPATEAIGAVVAADPSKNADFARIVMSFIDDPVLQRGVLWSARKIAEKRPDLLQDFAPQVIKLLDDEDPTTRGHAAWALGVMRDRDAIQGLENLLNDNSRIPIYDQGELVEKAIGELAADGLAVLKGYKKNNKAGAD